MKQLIMVLIMMGTFFVGLENVKGDVTPTMPCSLVLEPVNTSDVNAKGVALVYKVKLTASFPRTSISIHANHLPSPSDFGEYDGYEGFSFIANEISFRFKLYPTPEAFGPTWAGRIDDITANLANSIVEVRLSNSSTGKLGPAVLRNSINYCRLK